VTYFDLTGKTLGKYQILEEIGRGGMGTVYKAVQLNLGRHVALKVLLPSLASNTDLVRRFQREAQAVASLRHPNIVTVYDVGKDKDCHYIAMEYIQGESLKEYIRRKGTSNLNVALQILQEVAFALDYAHKQGFVHRDVKPSNVLLDHEMNRALLTDFGVVKAIQGTRLTRSGTFIGTAEYASPEQVLGMDIDYRSDLYSFGIMAYEMLSGKVPFEGDTISVLHSQVYEHPPTIRLYQPDLPPSVDAVLNRMLAKNPEERYLSAKEFVADLSRALTRQGKSANTFIKRTGRLSRREQPKLQWSTIILVISIIILGSLLTAAIYSLNGQQVDLGLVTESAHYLTATAPEQPLPASSPEKNNGRASPPLIENVGQFDDAVRFLAWGTNGSVFLTDNALWFTTYESSPAKDTTSKTPSAERLQAQGPRQGVALKVSFPNANPHPHLEPFARLDTHVSYFLGNDPTGWHANVPVYGGVRYRNLYPGVDLEVRAEGGHWHWRAVCQTDDCSAALQNVRLRVEGADALAVEGNHLRLHTDLGDISLPLLQAVSATGKLQPVAAQPQVTGREIMTPFSPAHPVTTDSTQDNTDALSFSTYLGGSGDEYGAGLAVDGNGNIYVAGRTYSADFPTSPGAFDTGLGGGEDAFVVKLNNTASTLLYATFIGGSGSDEGFGIALDSNGQVYLTGKTDSSDFPTTSGAFDTDHNGSWDAFVTKLNADGTALLYSTFIGGSGSDWGSDLAVNAPGEAFVVGTSIGSGFPTTSGAYQTSNHGGWDAFVLKLTAAGDALSYSTFVGGGYDDYGSIIAIDDGGAAYIGGWTASSDFPTTPGAFDTTYNGGGYGSGGDPYVTKINATGTALVYSTFLGGSGFDDAYAITLDDTGSAYLVGNTGSTDFPVTSGAYDTDYNGGDADGFVAKLNPDGSDLVFATYLGGSDGDVIWGIGRGNANSIYLYGQTNSPDFPTTSDAYDTGYNGGDCGSHACNDLFLAVLDANADNLTYGTYLGGSDDDYAWGEDMELADNQVYLSARTKSADFPTTPGAYDTGYNGGWDVAVVKLLVSDLVAYYPFNGNANDESGYGHHGQVYGATLTADRFGNTEQAYYFDGNSYISIPAAAVNDLPTGSVLAWIKLDQVTRGYCILDKTDSYVTNDIQWSVTPDGKLRLYLDAPYGQTQQPFYSNTSIGAGTWHQVAVTWDGTTCRFYLDGNADGASSCDGLGVPDSNLQPYIGKVKNDTKFMLGVVDDIRIYNRSLTEAEIRSLYDAEKPTPGPRIHHGWVYDSGRHRFVLFGGWDGNQMLNDTWEFDGSRWYRIDTPQAPSPRNAVTMVYDSDRQRVVLFGGSPGDSAVYGDTWEYDGTTWTQINTTSAPSARADVSMVYDAPRRRIILFGGTDQPGTSYHVFSDTWEFDGSNWVQKSPLHSPSARCCGKSSLMIYDSQRQRTILHAGWVGGGCNRETWEYDGNDWTLITSSGPSRYGHALAYDNNRGRVLFHGGSDCYQTVNDTWEYDPATTTWTQIQVATNPPAQCCAPIDYDPISHKFLMYGGFDSSDNILDELWAYDPTLQTWEQITTTLSGAFSY